MGGKYHPQMVALTWDFRHDQHISKYVKIWVWINTYENTIFRGMNIHKSQLF